jgi:hypothetical protein
MTIRALRRLYFVIFHLVDEFVVHLERSGGGVIANMTDAKNNQVFLCKGVRARFRIVIANTDRG